ncbi:MAG: FHA domain-containing protein [Actinomycetales bacterium]|nr:FHA domain-containing protein [Actinomycetales bacterium]
MKLKLTLNANGRDVDLVATVDATVRVGDLAARLAVADPKKGRTAPPAAGVQTLEFLDGDRGSLDPRAAVGESGLRSGAHVRLAWASEQFGSAQRAVLDLVVVEGPDRGRSFPVTSGTSYIGRGRGCEVTLTDPLASREHAKLIVSDVVEIVDLGTTNGTVVGGKVSTRAKLLPGDRVQIGDTQFHVRWKDEHHEAGVKAAVNGVLGFDGATVLYSRSPQVGPVFEGRDFPLPELPERPRRQPLPWFMAALPLVFAGVMYVMTQNLMSLIFFLMMPLMVLGNALEQSMHNKREFKELMQEFREDIGKIAERIRLEQVIEQAVRQEEHLSGAECVTAIVSRSPRLWFRRMDGPRYLELRAGLGTLASRCTTEMPKVGRSRADAWLELEQALAGLDQISDVPVAVCPLVEGAIGVAGPRPHALGVARSLVLQAVALHSPAELSVASFASTKTATDWDYLKWLPHVNSPHSPLKAEHLAATGPACVALADQVEELIEARRSLGRDDRPSSFVLVVIEGDAPIDRSRLVDLAERGATRGVAVLWVAEGQPRLPAVCSTYVVVEGDGAVGYVRQQESVTPVRLESCDAHTAATAARLLSPVVDAGVPSEDDSDLPSAVSFVTLAGPELATSPQAVIERWTESRSILTGPYAGEPNRRPANLRALIGQSALGAFSVDLRSEGPHALVGGTTGAGKSELLQAWILGMAAAHSPQRVTFLLVDYKGGSAFRECASLPHTLGDVVTDLSPHLVRRALISLSAELRYREHLLATYKAKDLVELERRGEADTPPSLVIVVDEFAALVQEVPDFVDGMVNVAQRGRSLGLHLILATQRPAGVIKDNLRANTNLRLALRMADEADSDDVLGSKDAALFDPAIPGRAMSKSGPGRLTSFQTGYAGGWTSDTPPPPKILVNTLVFGGVEEWVYEEAHAVAENPGPTDIKRLVSSIKEAAAVAQLPAPRIPWLAALKDVYDVANLPSRRTDEELSLGVIDLPDRQEQPTFTFHPDQDGNLAVYGISGSGKSAALRTVAIAAGYTIKGGPCHVYGLDFGNRGLDGLTVLPHVGTIVNGSDDERVARLITYLEQLVTVRSEAWAKVNASTITAYRRLAGQPDLPRIIVLIDGASTFKQNYEVSSKFHWLDRLGAVAGAGRPLGIHLVVSVDQKAGMPSALAPAIQTRVVQRMSADDCLTLGVPADVFDAETPPGRGLIGKDEVQFAVLGGSSDPTVQAAAISAFAAAARKAGVREAPKIESLAERVDLRELPAVVGGKPVLGVASSTLAPHVFTPKGTFVLTGPSGSGRTTALMTMCISTRRAMPLADMHLFTPRASSPLVGLGIWNSVSVGSADAISRARALAGEIRASPTGRYSVVVCERVDDLTADAGEDELEALVKACVDHELFVITEGDAQFYGTNFGLPSRARTSRAGLVLHPEGTEGFQIFRVDLPETDRRSMPPGRGFVIERGSVELVQVGAP